jgi:Concanavalin A-like lectin/glucanases superfamily
VALRALLTLLLLLCCGAGCTFQVDGLQPDGGASSLDLSAASTDLSHEDHSAAFPDLTLPLPDLSPPPPDLQVPFCGEPNLVACYQFEDNNNTGFNSTTAADGTANRNDLTLSIDTEVSGGHPSNALLAASGGSAHVAHNATFDITQLTLELWIQPTSLPGVTARAGLIDEDAQYSMFIVNPGVVNCGVAGQLLASGNNLVATGGWQHVACTYDQHVIRLYYNGVQVAMQNDTAVPVTGQTNGLSVGSNSPSGDSFLGLLDDVRIFSVARTAAEICADAGLSGC